MLLNAADFRVLLLFSVQLRPDGQSELNGGLYWDLSLSFDLFFGRQNKVALFTTKF